MNYLLIAVYLGILGFIVYRQFATQKVRPLGLLVFPGLLGFGTVQALGGAALGPVDVLLIALGLALGAATGLWRGRTYRIWSGADGEAWQKGSWMTLATWGVLVAIRIAFAIATGALGLHPAQFGGDLLASLFATFAAQNIVIWLRIRPRPIIAARTAS